MRVPSSSDGGTAAVVGGTDEPSGGTNVLTVVVGPAVVDVVLLARGRSVVDDGTVVGTSVVLVETSVVVVDGSVVVVVCTRVVVVDSSAEAGDAVTTTSARARRTARIGAVCRAGGWVP
jgi:hypothetical protein